MSHAFHTEIVAPASAPLGTLLSRLRLESPAIPLVANVDGEFYPMGPDVVPKMIAILERQIASPVQFVKGLHTLYDAGCRVFVEVGPKKALQGFVTDVLGDDPDGDALFTNHPKQGDVVSFNQALCGLYAAGHGAGTRDESAAPTATPRREAPQPTLVGKAPAPSAPSCGHPDPPTPSVTGDGDVYNELGHLFADFLSKGFEIFSGQQRKPRRRRARTGYDHRPRRRDRRRARPSRPGEGLRRRQGPAILHGEQFIDTIPVKYRQLIADKHITRLVKSEAGGGHFETIDNPADVIKLAGRGGTVDLAADFGFPDDRVDALDQAIQARHRRRHRCAARCRHPARDALQDHDHAARKLPERWMLPEAYRDTTGVIFASAFPGVDGLMVEVDRYWEAETRQAAARGAPKPCRSASTARERGRPDRRRDSSPDPGARSGRPSAIPTCSTAGSSSNACPMGHAQFAEYIGARGPNTQINARLRQHHPSRRRSPRTGSAPDGATAS